MRSAMGMRLAAALLVSISSAALAQPQPPASTVSPSLQEYRRHMFDKPVRTLANRTMALMFNTATIEAGQAASAIPSRLAPLNFSYNYEGREHPASDIIENTFTDALLIIKDGTIVHEDYYNRVTPQTHLNAYSMAKSMSAIMVGLALKQGLIKSVTDPVTAYVPELKGTGYDGASLRDLMEMRSGILWDENFFKPGTNSYEAHVASWVEERARYTDAALKTVHEHKPGTFFRYNSMDAGVMGLVVERATGKPVSQYLSEALWKPGGMESNGFYVTDGPPGVGREFTAGGFNAVLRDYGRIGLLMLNNGELNGKSFFPTDFVSSLRKDITDPAAPGLGYGWFWWTVKGTEAFSAVGGEGQYIYVDPRTRTVIVKLSHGPVGPDAGPDRAQTLAFMKAATAWAGR